jgi:hypothetical protein
MLHGYDVSKMAWGCNEDPFKVGLRLKLNLGIGGLWPSGPLCCMVLPGPARASIPRFNLTLVSIIGMFRAQTILKVPGFQKKDKANPSLSGKEEI